MALVFCSVFRRPIVLHTALFLASLAAASYTFDPELSRSGDNAEYIILGRSLAQGEGMRLISHPQPAPTTKFPPLFPLMLAGVEWAAPGSILHMKAMVSVLFALSVVLAFRLFQKAESTGTAVAVATTCLVSPHVLNSAHAVMSEIPFMMFSLACLLAVQSQEAGPRKTISILLFGGAAFYVRTAGIALLVSILLFYCIRRAWRTAAVLAGGFGVIALPWSLYVQAQGGSVYTRAILRSDPYDLNSGYLGVMEFLYRFTHNLWAYATRHIGSLVNPFLSEFPHTYDALDAIGHGLLLVCVLVYFWRSRGRFDLLPLYLLTYLGMLFCWPEVWTSMRFLVPISPLVFGAVYAGGRALLYQLPLKPAVIRAACAAAVVVLIAVNVGANTLMLRARSLDPAWQDYYSAAEWINKHAPHSTIVACRKPHLMYLRSGRRSVRYAFEPPPGLVRHLYESNVGVLVVDGLGEFDSNRRFLFPAAREYGELLQQVYRSDYVTVAALHPDPGDRYGRLADAHLEEGDTLAAIESLRKLNALFPEDATSLRRLEDLAKRGK